MVSNHQIDSDICDIVILKDIYFLCLRMSIESQDVSVPWKENVRMLTYQASTSFI